MSSCLILLGRVIVFFFTNDLALERYDVQHAGKRSSAG